MPNLKEDFKDVLNRPNLRTDFADVLEPVADSTDFLPAVEQEPPITDFLPAETPPEASPQSTRVAVTPRPEGLAGTSVDFSPGMGSIGVSFGAEADRRISDPAFNEDLALEEFLEKTPTNLSPAVFNESLLKVIDNTFSVPKTVEGLRTPEQFLRLMGRTVVGIVAFMPVLGAELASPPEGMTRREVLEDTGIGLLQMIRRFPFQMARLAGIKVDPTKPLNPLDELLIARGLVKTETIEEIEQGLITNPEEPLFTLMIATGSIKGARKILKKRTMPAADLALAKDIDIIERTGKVPEVKEGFVIRKSEGRGDPFENKLLDELETNVKEVKTGQDAARLYGLEFKGKQQINKSGDQGFSFNDPFSDNTTITVKNFNEIPDKLNAVRKKFEEGREFRKEQEAAKPTADDIIRNKKPVEPETKQTIPDKSPPAYELTKEEFKSAAVRGELRLKTGTELPGESKAKTPLRLGEINKFSNDDIATFYATRSGLELGRKELVRDAIAEGKTVPPEVLKDFPDLAPPAEITKKPMVKRETVTKVTDQADIQKLKNAIAEGQLTLRTGRFDGKKQSPEQLEVVRRQVDRDLAKIGEKDEVVTPKEAVADIIEGKLESKIGLKEFKTKMTAELDAAIEKLTKEETTFTIEEVPDFVKSSDPRPVEIHIPGDGDFMIENRIGALKEVKTKVRRLTEKVPRSKSETIGTKRTTFGKGGEKEITLKEALESGQVTFTPTGKKKSSGGGAHGLPATGKIISGKEVAKFAEEFGTDQGFVKFDFDRLKKRNFEKITMDIDALRKSDLDLDSWIKAGQERTFEGRPNIDAPVIVFTTELIRKPFESGGFEVMDGYNRILARVLAKHKTVDAFVEIGKAKAKDTRGAQGLPKNQPVISKGDLGLFEYNEANTWNADLVATYRERIRNGEQIDPIEVVLDDKGAIFVVDGHHRARAAQLEGKEIPFIESPDAAAGIAFIDWETKPKIKGSTEPSISGTQGLPVKDPQQVRAAEVKLEPPKTVDQSAKSADIGRQEIADYFRKAFAATIRTGKFRQYKAAGIFKTKEEVIRVREANNIDVISHELGHYLDKTNALRKRKMDLPTRKELVQMGRDLYGERKPVGGYRSEGIAEYFAFWLTTDRVAEIAPKFHKYFEKEILANDPVLRNKLIKGRNLIRKWQDQGAAARVYANIDFSHNETFSVAKQGRLKELFMDAALRINTLFADDLVPLEFVEKRMRGVTKLDLREIDPITSPTMIARAVSQAATGKAREMVLHGTFDFGLNKTGPSLREVLTPVSKDMKNFLTYSYAKRAQELWKRSINPGISRKDANFVVENMKRDTYDKVHQGLTDFEGRVMDYLIDAGGISEEAAIAIRMLNPGHIPLKRVIEGPDFVGTGGRRLADLTSPIKRIKGSGLKIKDPIESIIANTASIISVADKVRVQRALIDLAEGKQGAGKYIEKLPKPIEAKKFRLQDIADQLQDAGVKLDEASMDEVLTVYSNAGQYRGRDNIVSLWRNGEREFYEIDKRLYSTFKALDQFHLPPTVDFFFGKPARAIRLGATGLNLGFGLITNPLRDAMTFALQTEFTRGTPDLVAKGMARSVQINSKIKTMFRRSGADFSQFLGLDRFQLRKAVNEVLASDKKMQAINVVKHPIELLKDIISIPESAPRLAEFEGALKFAEEKFGKGSESAAIIANRAASEVTVNFRTAGVYGRAINQIVPFWNAAKEGVFRFARFHKQHPVKAFTKGIAGITIPTVLIWMENKDRDWYRDAQPWLKYGFWNFEIGRNEDGSAKVLRLPKPFEWGVVYGAAPEMVLDYWYARDPAIITDGLEYMIEQTIPIGPQHIPATVKIAVEVAANYDFFKERPIDPFFEVRYKEPEDRFSPYTLETAKFLGRQFGMSPRKINHVIRSATGGLAEDVLRAGERALGLKPEAEDRLANIPILGRLFARIPSDEARSRKISFHYNREIQRIKTLIKNGKQAEADKKTENLKRYLRLHKVLEGDK